MYTIKDFWDKDCLCLSKSGIYLPNDTFIELTYDFHWGDGYPSPNTIHVAHLQPISFDCLLEDDDVTPVESGIAAELKNEALDLHVGGGGGPWGSAGVVTARRLRTRAPLWVAFFEDSNDFIDIEISDGLVIATSNHEDKWKFPISEPWLLKVN